MGAGVETGQKREPAPSGRPLESRRTRALLRRQWYRVCAATVLAAALIASGVLLHDQRGHDLRRLEAHGVRVVGVVDRTFETEDRTGDKTVHAVVSYVAGGTTLTATVTLADGSSEYRSGEHVTVVYDPARPQRMTIRGQDHSSGVVFALMLIAAFVLIGAALRARRARRWRRVLAGGEWRVYGFELAPLERSPHAALALTPTDHADDPDEAAPDDDLIRVTGVRWAGEKPGADRIWLAESADLAAVVATPGPHRLYAAKRAKRRSERKFWQDALERSRRAAGA